MPEEIENIICNDCSSVIENESDQNENPSDDIVCDDCLSSNYSSCDNCGRCVDNDDITNVDDTSICENCLERNYVRCDSCNDWTESNSTYSVENDDICYTCYDNDTEECEDCEERFHSNHFNNADYHSCMRSNKIHEYHYKPQPEFFGEGTIHYGVELEVECENDRDDDAEKISSHGEFVYFKHDGSLDDGFEIVSHPATLKYHQENHWKDICKTLTSNKVRSHDTKTCGLHVHMSRNGMDEGHIKKFVMFWYTQNKIVQSIARRGFDHYYQDKDLKLGKGRMAFVPSSVMLRSETRYEQINFENKHTIEIRRFKGTLNPVSLIACIELVDAVRTFTKNCSYKFLHEYETTEKYFVAWLFSNKNIYPNLFDRIRTKMNLQFESDQE